MLKKVYLEITNVCNLNCAFCPGTVREHRFMTVGEFDFLTDRIRPHTQYLYFHLMGEPLLHPRLADFLELAGDKGFKVIITTNGTLLPKCGNILTSSASVHKVNISLQSFEANEKGELRSYIDGCAAFAKRTSENGKLCVFRLWNEKGMNTLNAEIERILTDYFPKPWKDSRGSRALEEHVWLEPGEKFDWPDMSAPDMGKSCFCYGLRDQIGVLCDGAVVPCCLDREGSITIGNLFKNSLDEIMSTKRARAIYDGFSRREAVEELCRKCVYARRFT